jgi:hypothetical protein
MIAARRTPTADERRQMERDDALFDLVTQIAGLSVLSHNAEMAVREAATMRIARIVEAAVGLVSAGVELEAIDRRPDNHVRHCRECPAPRGCWQLGVLRRRHGHLLHRWDRAYRTLVTI